MNRKPLPDPPQMRNGGLPPAHLPSSSLSDPLAWLHYKWLQPPPRAPYWVFDYYEHYNPPAGVSRPLRDEKWHQRAVREDQQTAGLLPPSLPGGPILHGARARLERTYHDWKQAINDLWADELHCLFLLDEEAARARHQEAARRQQLLDEQAARARQEAAAACARQEAAAARARQEAARCQQLLNEQEQEATRACLKDALAKETCRPAALTEAKRHEDALAAEERQRAALAKAEQEASKFAAKMASLQANMAELRWAAEALALIKEHHRHEAVLAAEADDQHRHEVAAWAAEALALIEERCRHEAVLATEADDRRRHEAATQAVEALALVKERCRHEAVLAAEAND